MADAIARLKEKRQLLVDKANEASDRATRDRAMVAEGKYAQERLDEYERTREQDEAEIHRLNASILKKEEALIKPAACSHPRRSPFTSWQSDLVAHARNARFVAEEAEEIARRSAPARRSASSPRARH